MLCISEREVPKVFVWGSLVELKRSLSTGIMVSWGPSWAEMLEFPDPGINRLEIPEHTTVQLIKILVSIQQQSQFSRDKIKREIINVTSKCNIFKNCHSISRKISNF